MPAPALKSLAKKAGKSMKDAERYYDAAKKQRMKSTGKSETGLTGSDYSFIMGVVKKRLGLATEGLAESMIDARVSDLNDFDVRVFTDLEGEVSFSTIDDIHIDPSSDVRVEMLHKLANEYDWPHNHPFPESIDGYEGSVRDLAQQVLQLIAGGLGEVADPVKPHGPRKKSLAQKQGERKAGRTRSRRQYRESLNERAGYLHHFYYDGRKPTDP